MTRICDLCQSYSAAAEIVLQRLREFCLKGSLMKLYQKQLPSYKKVPLGRFYLHCYSGTILEFKNILILQETPFTEIFGTDMDGKLLCDCCIQKSLTLGLLEL